MSLRAAFLAGLCEEHGSELAFLYQRRVQVMDQPLAQWPLLLDLEERIEAHAAAITVEPEPVRSMAEQWLEADDPNLRYAGLRALAGTIPSDDYWQAFTATPWDDGAHARAATDALIATATADWTTAIARQLGLSHGRAASALATAAVVHRLPVAAAIEVAASTESTHLADLLWALGQLDHAPAAKMILAHLQTGTPSVRQSAAIAALRIMGQEPILPWLVSQLDKGTWAVLPLALCGGSRAVTALLPALLSGPLGLAPLDLPDVDWWMALGLIGSPASFDRLLSALAHEPIAEAAAAALQLTTGAGLVEEVVTVDEETLDPDELAALRAGQLDPKRVGEVHRRLCRDERLWRGWLDTRRSAFVVGQRYRHGRVFAMPTASPALMSEWLPRAWRENQVQELEIQSRLRVGLYAELPVSEQQRRLSTALAAVSAIAKPSHVKPTR
jgi:hypothetical protein